MGSIIVEVIAKVHLSDVLICYYLYMQSSYLCFSNEYFSLKRDTTPFVNSTGNLTSDGTPATKLNRTRMKVFKRVPISTTRIEPNRQKETHTILRVY